LNQIIGFMPLTETLKATSSAVPNPFPDEFFTVNPKNRFMGDVAEMVRITGERRTAQLAKRGAPATRRNLRDVGSQDVRMLMVYETITIDPIQLQNLRSFESYTQDKGIDWLSYQMDEAAHRVKNTEVISVATTLLNGAIYFDGLGNLLPSSSGAVETYSFNVPANNQNQLNGIISASWANHSTDIPNQIRALRQQATQTTGIMFNKVLYGKNVPSYITQNDFCQPYLARMGDMRDKFLHTGEIPNGLFDLEWSPVYTTFYERSDPANIGTNQLIWNDDACVFVPEVNQADKMSWYAMYQGSFSVPRSIEVKATGMAALENFEIVYGPFAYAGTKIDPPSVNIFYGSIWLGGIRNPGAIWQSIVAF
jgi:hypothetical protein